ncbi:MAG: hypothetical protein ACJAVI_002122 [Candidatus Azotimanducaceae bacterium]|jgi:hypothetical protein
MAEILLTFVILLMIVAAMSVGVLMGRKPISGSCGGLANAGVGGPCDICGGDMSKCDSEEEMSGRSVSSIAKATADSPGFVDASAPRVNR